MRAFEYRHTVGFEETNLVGNVYYVNHLRWQGRCREIFLGQHAPEVLSALSNGLRLVTTRCSCEYFAEIFALDEIVIRMRLGAIVQNRVSMLFDYYRGPDLVARGEQEVAFLRMNNDRAVVTRVPEPLMFALQPFAADPL
jgi:enediyne biosynthesis thioesterase